MKNSLQCNIIFLTIIFKIQNLFNLFHFIPCFITTLEKIDCINKAGIKSVIMTTVSGTNIKEIPDIIDLVVKHKVRIFAFARYCPTSDEKDVGIEPLEYRKLLDT